MISRDDYGHLLVVSRDLSASFVDTSSLEVGGDGERTLGHGRDDALARGRRPFAAEVGAEAVPDEDFRSADARVVAPLHANEDTPRQATARSVSLYVFSEEGFDSAFTLSG